MKAGPPPDAVGAQLRPERWTTPRRYAIHLITAAALLAGRRKATAVDVEDVSKAYSMFLDVKRSTHVRTRAVSALAMEGGERSRGAAFCRRGLEGKWRCCRKDARIAAGTGSRRSTLSCWLRCDAGAKDSRPASEPHPTPLAAMQYLHEFQEQYMNNAVSEPMAA